MRDKPTVASKARDRNPDSLPKDDAAQADETHDFIVRNRDALNQSIRKSRADLQKGIHSTRSFDDIIADGHRRNKNKP